MIEVYVPGPIFPGIPLLDPILRDITYLLLLAVVVIALVRLATRKTAFGTWAVIALLFWVVATGWLTMEPGDAERINLVPFSFISGGSAFEPASNVLLFIPLGLVLGAIGWRLRFVVITGLGVSLVIEVTQYLVNLGRAADVDDLIENTFGALVGCLVALLLRRMMSRQHAPS